MHGLIDLQAFDGYWDASTALARLLHLTEAQLRAKGGVTAKVKTRATTEAGDRSATRVWTSLLVLAWLEAMAAAEQEKEVWELVAEKARAWIEGVGGVEGVEASVVGEWESEAKALVAGR